MRRLATMTRWGIAAAVAASCAAALAGCAAKAPPTAAQAARSVSVVRVEMKPIAGGIVTSGILIPRNQVAINPDLSGYRVSRLYVDEGDWVKAGQPLLQIAALQKPSARPGQHRQHDHDDDDDFAPARHGLFRGAGCGRGPSHAGASATPSAD